MKRPPRIRALASGTAAAEAGGPRYSRSGPRSKQSPTMGELLHGVGQFMPHLGVRPNTGIAPAPHARTFYPAVGESCLAARSRIGA
jgi:hypothetical protein